MSKQEIEAYNAKRQGKIDTQEYPGKPDPVELAKASSAMKKKRELEAEKGLTDKQLEWKDTVKQRLRALKPDKKYWLEDLPRFRPAPTSQIERGSGLKKVKKGAKVEKPKIPPYIQLNPQYDVNFIYKWKFPLDFGTHP